jgi:hypothetical protein
MDDILISYNVLYSAACEILDRDVYSLLPAVRKRNIAVNVRR